MTRSQISSLKPALLIYDIPENVPVLPNPSGILYPVAIRLQFSGWVIPEDRFPKTYFENLERRFQDWLITERGQLWANSRAGRRHLRKSKGRGITWLLAPFDPNRAEVLLAPCEESIRQEIVGKIENAQRTYAAEEEALEAEFAGGMITLKERLKRQKKYRRQMTLVIKRCDKLLADVQQAAAQFGISVADTAASAEAVIRGIDAAFKTHVRQYVETTDELAAALGVNNPVVRAARADNIPGEILADYADDHNINGNPLRLSVSALQAAWVKDTAAE